MPNGSLDDCLHSAPGQLGQKSLSILQRINIAIDVASALQYLHHQCQTPVAHCDVKPTNVLLDTDMTAHVSDSGLARLLSYFNEEVDLNQFSSLGIKGTIGYAAPEYGMGGEVTTQGDVYSYGILLLELFTGRRPTNDRFSDDVNLHIFVKAALPDQVTVIVDQSTLYSEVEENNTEKDDFGSKWTHEQTEHLISILQIGVSCSEESPASRMNMKQAAMDLQSIKDRLFGLKI